MGDRTRKKKQMNNRWRQRRYASAGLGHASIINETLKKMNNLLCEAKVLFPLMPVEKISPKMIVRGMHDERRKRKDPAG